MLVTYQKSEKSMVWLPRNAQKYIFFTPFSPFLAKKIFFSKIRLRQFFGTIESYLDAKNQKKLWRRSSGIHPDGRTDGRTDESKSIGPPKFFGSVQKSMEVNKLFTTATIQQRYKVKHSNSRD